MPARGEPLRQIRMSDAMWEAFGESVKQAEPELDRSKVIREFIRWHIGETDELPRRPAGTVHAGQAKHVKMQ